MSLGDPCTSTVTISTENETTAVINTTISGETVTEKVETRLNGPTQIGT